MSGQHLGGVAGDAQRPRELRDRARPSAGVAGVDREGPDRGSEPGRS
ncbi:hypothetical protein [Kutzneria buriramensis]|nr:hypothetical protein [Kutzneria buriramensis]